jgi:hypothetical protein
MQAYQLPKESGLKYRKLWYELNKMNGGVDKVERKYNKRKNCHK